MPAKETQKKPLFLIYGDGMRLVAVLAVIMLHSSAQGVVRYGILIDSQWWIANFIDSACRWCVPVFIMLSGTLLLDPAREEPLLSFYRRRLSRVLIPLIFWSSFYFIWSRTFRGENVTLQSIVSQIKNGMRDNHLYFFFLIVGLYFIAPALRIFTKYTEYRVQWAITFLLFALYSIKFSVLDIGSNALTAFFPYISYFLIGYLLREKQIERKTSWFAGIIFVLSVVITAIGTGFLFAQSDGNLGLFYDHFSPSVIAESISSFLLIAYFFRRHEKLATSRLMTLLGGAAFGIYLVHVAILDILRGFTSSFYNDGVLPTVIIEVAVTYLISAGIVITMRRIAFFRYIVG